MGRTSLAVAASRNREVLSDDAWSMFLQRCREEIAWASDPGDRVVDLSDADTALVACGPNANRLTEFEGRRSDLLTTSAAMPCSDGTTLSLEALVRSRSADPAIKRLREVCPPFAYLVREPAAQTVLAGTDSLGLQHVYLSLLPGLAVVSSSSALVARLADTTLDQTACGLYSQLGSFLGNYSMFKGVTKLTAGEQVRLVSGASETVTDGAVVPEAVRKDGFFETRNEAISEGKSVLAAIIRSYRDLHRSLRFELSGGLDSRLLLAVVRASDSDPIRTLTIGVETSPDYRIAAELVQQFGLDASFVPFSQLGAWNDDEAVERVYRASADRDFAANPMSGAIHALVSQQLPGIAQVTGQGGELGRGSYYAGQRVQPEFDANKVASLVRWRLSVNQAVNTSLLTDAFASAAAEALRVESWRYFDGLDGAWPAVTDQIYLFGRMQRWAGAVYSQRHRDHDVLAPFFHPAYVDWASRIPVEMKRNSRTFVGMLEAFDPELARIPLDSGLTPLELADQSIMGRARLTRRDARRAVRKVHQRLARRRHTPAGVDLLADLIVAGWRRSPPTNLQHVPWLDSAAIDRVLTGDLDLDPVSVGFLVNLDAALGLLAKPWSR